MLSTKLNSGFKKQPLLPDYLSTIVRPSAPRCFTAHSDGCFFAGSLYVDHELKVPLSIAYDRPSAWPALVIPVCVNFIQHPLPTAMRCYKLGQAIGRAVASFNHELAVSIWGTSGLSHQLGGERAGLVNPNFDKQFLDNLVNDPVANTKLLHTEFIREAAVRVWR